MPTRREQLFSAKKTSAASNVIPATVRFKIDKKKGRLDPLPPEQKMLCALRKVLSSMSGREERWCIMGNKVEITSPPSTTEGKPGGPQSYRAAGRCKVAVMRGDGMVTKFIQFSISYRDTLDALGIADVEYFDPTVIDEIKRGSPTNLSALA
jgi:hypothetical protein